jgi:hypothetical protein
MERDELDKLDFKTFCVLFSGICPNPDLFDGGQF